MNTDLIARLRKRYANIGNPLDKEAADALEAKQPIGEPLFWYRPVGTDGLYEGPVHHKSVGGKMLRDEKPGEWKPLFLHEAKQRPKKPTECTVVCPENQVCDYCQGIGGKDVSAKQRPMTDEEIDALVWKYLSIPEPDTIQGITEFARAIEAHHGIK